MESKNPATKLLTTLPFQKLDKQKSRKKYIKIFFWNHGQKVEKKNLFTS